MGRILGLDIGTKRIGVSVSDIMHLFAQPLSVIKADRGNPIEEIKKIIEQREVTTVVFGMPYNEEGEPSKMGEYILEFIEKFKGSIDTETVKIELWDERYSSNAAEDILLSADVSRKKRKKVIDKVASTIILQSYMDSKLS